MKNIKGSENMKIKKIQKAGIIILFLLILSTFAIAGVPTYTKLSSAGSSWFKEKVGIGTDTPTVELDVVGDTLITGTQDIVNAGAGNGLYIDQKGNGIGLNIDSEATTRNIVTLSKLAGNTGIGIDLKTTDSLQSVQFLRSDASGDGTNLISRNIASTGTAGAIFKVTQAHATDDQPTAYLLDNGVGNTLRLNKDGTSGNVLNVENEGTGYGLFIDQNGDAPAISINKDGTHVIIELTANDGTCVAGDYGFYTVSGNIYWCKNGAGTMLN